MSSRGGKWRWTASFAILLFFIFSIAWQTRAAAEQSLAEQLLEIMRANHQISEAQYKKLKKQAEEQKAAQMRTEKEYKKLKNQVEKQQATAEDRQIQTETRYAELKKQVDKQNAAQAVMAGQTATPKTKAASGKKISANNQLRETGTGTGGGGMSFHMHGIKVNIGGFIEAAGIYRNRWLGADVDSPFQNLPLRNSPHYYQNETRFTARQSRLSIMAQGDYSPTVHLTGYYEMDFLGAAPSANSNESNSYNMRIRHLFALVHWETYGLRLLCGQTWSLVTLDSKGIIPLAEEIPLTIDAQYVPGFNWARQPQFRIVKDWNKKFWLGLSVENPQTTYSSEPDAPANFPVNYSLNQAPGSLFASNLSVNNMPDIVEKAAYDCRFGHFELFNLTRTFNSSLEVGSGPKSLNSQNITGDAVGGGFIIPLYGQKLTLQTSGMYGDGIGRYGSGQLPDVTQDANGAIHPIPAFHLLSGLIWSPSKAFTMYSYFGMEQAQRKYYTANGVAYGYGNPLYDTYVYGLGVPGAFQGQIQSIAQITVGEWWNFYHGNYGNMVWGLQYSYTMDNYFSGSHPGPQANDSMFFSSFRYYWN